MKRSVNIINAALRARTLDQVLALQNLIASDIGSRYERPLGDRWNNVGLLTRTGSADHKLLEMITNQQDAVLERFAVSRFGSYDAVPYTTPHEAASDLLQSLSWQDIAYLVTVEFHESDGSPRTKRSADTNLP